MRRNGVRLVASLTFALAWAAGPGRAQARVDVRAEAFAGSEMEDYLRVLQVAGQAPLYPWSIRAFSPAEVDRLLPTTPAHPLARHYGLSRDTARGARLRWIRPNVRLVENTGFAYGENDGPVWAGRGVTVSAQAGFAWRAGPLSLTLAPVAFLAQNQSFPLLPTGLTGRLAYADPHYPFDIDQPQRFGDRSYGRVDPGESTLRFDAGFLALGLSTASQVWGPAVQDPLILGNNAGGFPHGFVGTARPLPIGIGRLHGRVVWGRLDQTAYSSMPRDSSRRFMAGAVVTFLPRGIPGLELGGSRFFHTRWPDNGIAHAELGLPFEGLLKKHLGGGRPSDQANQLASVFFRWVLPKDGVEAWGEYAREDHSYDLRDFVLEPDHSAGFGLGLRKVWTRASGSLLAVRAEVVDTRVTHIENVRGEGPFYIHSERRQGHTERGQALGSAAAFGGGGATLALDSYSAGGRWSLSWRRELLGQLVTPDRRVLGFGTRHSISAERVFFRGATELSAGATAQQELGAQGRRDRFNLSAVLGARLGL
jgi:hypothetical protein